MSLEERRLEEISGDKQQTVSVLTQFSEEASSAEAKSTSANLVATSAATSAANSVAINSVTFKPTTAQTAEGIEQWIVTYLSEMLEISEDEIETDVSFDTYGLDSSAAVGLTGDLEDWLGQEVDPTILYDYPTVESLASYLSADQKEVSYDRN